jgi:uncharacterized alkaline shock family protein YloU
MGVVLMITLVNPNGTIEITQEYFANLIGYATSCCYGVAGMAASSPVQGITSLFGGNKANRGVKVRYIGGQLVIELHIIVTFGVNIAVIVKSIVNKVSYTVEEATGLNVSFVNVFVDSMKTE